MAKHGRGNFLQHGPLRWASALPSHPLWEICIFGKSGFIEVKQVATAVVRKFPSFQIQRLNEALISWDNEVMSLGSD